MNRRTKHGRRRETSPFDRWILVVVAGLALAAGLALLTFGCQTHAASPPPPTQDGGAPSPKAGAEGRVVRIAPSALDGLGLTIVPVRARVVREEVSTFLAETRLRDDASFDVVAPATGIVQRLGPATGERLRAGQHLATLRSAEVGRARAGVQVARARADEAERVEQRASALFRAGVGVKKDVQAAAGARAIARARLAETRAELAALGVGLQVPTDLGAISRVVLRAPRAGTVVERPVRVGASVASGGLLYRAADLARLWLVARVGEADAARIAEDAPARIRFAAQPKIEFTGRVARSTGVVDPRTRTVELRLEVDDDEARLRPGMAATVHLALGEKSEAALVVPQAALQRLDGHWWVFVPRGGGVFEQRPVARGRAFEREVEVRGLRAGERVVAEGAFFLRTEATRATDEEK